MNNGLKLYGMAVLGLAMILGPLNVEADSAEKMTLSESLDLAVKRSVLAHSTREGILGAEAQQKEAFTGFLPKFGTSYNYTRLNAEPYFNFPGIEPLIPAKQMTMGTKDNYTWSIEARQPLFAGGAIRSNYEASRIGTDIARQEHLSNLRNLVLEVKSAYFGVLKANRVLDVAKQSVERLKAHRETALGFYDAGLIPRNDLLRAEVELANGHQSLLSAMNAKEMAEARFNTLLRREIGTAVEIEDTLTGRPYGATLEGCIAAALERRSELQSASLRVRQAQSLVRQSEADYYPSVNLVGNYSRYGDTPGVSGTIYKPQESWYAMVVANWNFWEWGKTKHRVEAGISREKQAVDALDHTRDQIVLEVKNAYLLLREAEKQVQVSEKAAEQAEENFRINTERYREQVGTATDVIDAQTLLTKSRSDYANALSDCAIQQARLERAMGEEYRGEERP